VKRTIVFPSSAPTSRAFNSQITPANLAVKFFLLIVLSLIISSCGVSTLEIPVPLPEPAVEQPEPELELESDLLPKPIFGAYTYGGVWSGMAPIYDLEADLGQRLGLVHWFMGWNNAWDASLLEMATEGGREAMVSWESIDVSLAEIVSGEQDAYIQSWAEGAAAFEKQFYLRPFPEMNGDWTPWNGQPDLLIAAWKHVVDIFDAAGADNVLWVWAPNITDEPRIESNRMELYYPGAEYVDVLALDGYNWGTTRSWSEWMSFEEVFAAPYERIAALGDQPIWLAEVASAEQGGDKSAWIEDMFASTAFPRLEALVWFNEDKEAKWHVTSSDAVLASFQTALSESIQVAGLD